VVRERIGVLAKSVRGVQSRQGGDHNDAEASVTQDCAAGNHGVSTFGRRIVDTACADYGGLRLYAGGLRIN